MQNMNIEIKLNNSEAIALYKFYRYQKYDFKNEMNEFYIKNNIHLENILKSVYEQYLEQFSYYKKSNLDKDVYIFKFSKNDSIVLYLFTNVINYSFLSNIFSIKYTEECISRLHKTFKNINTELKNKIML